MIDPDQLVGTAEIADAAGVTRPLVYHWTHRRLDFPTPVAHLSTGPLWLWPEVRAWLDATGRDTTPDGQQVRAPYGPYDRHEDELTEVDRLVTSGLDIMDACAIVAGQSIPGERPRRRHAHRLRHLYPGWKARERTRMTP